MVLVLAALVLGACGDEELPRATQKNPVETTRRPAPATVTPSGTPGRAPEVPAEARRQSAALPLEQRVGQLFVVGFEGTDLSAPVFEQLAGHGWGGIVISEQNAPLAGLAAGEALVRAEIDPLIASEIDGVPGVTLELGPDVDVPIVGRPDVDQATAIARRAVRDDAVVHAIGHFPGQGAASQDPIEGPAQVAQAEADLRERDLVPFAAVATDAPAFVVSSASYLAYDPVTPAAHVPAIVKDLLRDDLGFGGVAMTDDLAGLEAATGQGPGDAAIAAIDAGIDLVYVPDPGAADVAYAAVLEAVQSGKLDASRVRDAAARVLALKARVAPPAPSPG